MSRQGSREMHADRKTKESPRKEQEVAKDDSDNVEWEVKLQHEREKQMEEQHNRKYPRENSQLNLHKTSLLKERTREPFIQLD